MLPKPFQLSALTSRDLQLESAWKRFIVRPRQLPAPVESREPQVDEMKLLLVIGGAVAAAGIFLLATASGDTALLGMHYPLLLVLNAALAALLAALVVYQLVMLARRYRARVFGARLTLRLLVRFAVLAVVPGLIVYAVSVQFLTRSIESWFDVKVDAALEGGINLGQQAIDQMMAELQAKARAMALELADRPQPQIAARSSACARRSASRRRWWSPAAGAWWRAPAQMSPGWCPSCRRRSAAAGARQPRLHRGRCRRRQRRSRCACWCRSTCRGIAESRASCSCARRAAVARAQRRGGRGGYRDYRELAISRDGLKRIYVVTLTLRPADGAVRRRRRGGDPVRICSPSRSPTSRRHAGGGARRFLAAARRSPAATSSACSPSRSTP